MRGIIEVLGAYALFGLTNEFRNARRYLILVIVPRGLNYYAYGRSVILLY